MAVETITYDATSSITPAGSQSSPQTVSHTCTGFNRALVVTFYCGAANVNTSYTSPACTYNSVPMTLIKDQVETTANQRRIITFALANPTVGTNTISMSWAGGGSETGLANVSYTGVAQSSPVDVSVS